MTIALAVALVVLGALVGWRWWLAFRRWEIETARALRDDAVKSLLERMTVVEKTLSQAQWTKALKP